MKVPCGHLRRRIAAQLHEDAIVQVSNMTKPLVKHPCPLVCHMRTQYGHGRRSLAPCIAARLCAAVLKYMPGRAVPHPPFKVEGRLGLRLLDTWSQLEPALVAGGASISEPRRITAPATTHMCSLQTHLAGPRWHDELTGSSPEASHGAPGQTPEPTRSAPSGRPVEKQ
ncbi:hypothetical protein P154DRAFT_575516 [Amniculicola lignicola CBS 123094]|uniref:Uncharacterized protein n=1 Tax=Amniculicola lignicola CBS 123094 TaxID=1392246 RepID=A0A6A5WIP3_9PLEO|nr:hypothetical protein P154DRAFT_575516 [Amniculicola lignicola CBS 123094]